MFGYFLRLATPIDFQAWTACRGPRLLLLSPPMPVSIISGAGQISRTCRTARRSQAARRPSKDALFALLVGEETRDAA